jgi:hypothetical protein
MKASRLFVALLLFRAATAGARMEQDMGVRPDSGVKITLGSCFDNLSLAGFAPVDVTINNHSGEPRKWVLEFSSPGYTYGNMDTISSTFVVTAEDNGTRTIPLLVPATDPSGVQMPPVQVRISGYGVDGSDSQQIGARSWNGKKATAFVAISESLGTKIWSDLQKHLDDNGRDLIGSTVNPDELPEDWRGLTGVAALWLRQDELDHLDPAQRNAIQTWVHTGGQLMLCGAASVPGDMRFPGFGAVTLLPASLDIEATRDAIDRLPRHASDFDAFGSPQRALLAAVSPNVPLLSSFMAIFAFVIGPFNIYALARRRRERLFWTTPLISLGASGLLVGMIVIQDGAGGHGVRGATVCIFPQSRTAVVAQEQLSRTGLLFNSSFETRDPAWIEQLGIQRSNPSGYNPMQDTGRELQNDGNSYGRNWFASRAAQAQRIITVTPTRAEITLMNAADAATGAAPVIVSSFATTLDTILYIGPDQRRWQGKDVRTGQRQTLELDNAASVMIPSTDLSGGSIRPANSIQPGMFWAAASQSSDYVATLGSIHWTDEPVTYVGPVTSSP